MRSPAIIPKAMRILRLPGSKSMREVRYDITTKMMRIKFTQTKSTWEFLGVDPKDFAELAISDSPGKYFNDNIRDKYASIRLSPKPDDTKQVS